MPSTPPQFAASGAVVAPGPPVLIGSSLAASRAADNEVSMGGRSPPAPLPLTLPMPMPATGSPEDELMFRPQMSYLRRSTTGPADCRSDHDLRKERERRELVEMILESIASVPVAVERIHTNSKLRAALQDAMGEQNALLGRFFSEDAPASSSSVAMEALEPEKKDDEDDDTIPESLSAENLRRWDEAQRQDRASLPHEIFSDYSSDAKGAQSSEEDHDNDNDHDNDGDDDEDDDDGSSGFGSEFEKDLAEAVNQLCMSDEALVGMERHLSDPIAIAGNAEANSTRISNSPRSSLGLGASPGSLLLDGEPVSALWPRQPNQFAFSQADDVTVRDEDEVYSEMVGSSVCGDESLHDDGDDPDEKLFQMEDDDADDDLDNELSAFFPERTMSANDAATFLTVEDAPATNGIEVDVKGEVGDNDENEDDGDDDDDDDDAELDGKREYEVFQLRILREKNRTGFEPNQDWRPRVGRLIGGRYKVQMAIGEAVFSRTYKCLDITTNQTVCLKIIKNNKEYFDQGVDEIRVLEFIARNCNVDDKHLVRLIDYFYVREHLIIVTELLRDNLYEFSRLLMERGVINFFNMARLKKIAVEVLEALQFLHSLGLVHCDLKPENILVGNFSECTVKVIDFGSACFVTDELTSYVQSRSYRAPEVILGIVYDQKIDIWSLGCVLAELFTGEVLFKNDSEQTLLARILATIGPIPASLLADRADLRKQLQENALFAVDAAGNGTLAASLLLPPLEDVVQTVDTEFLSFLRALLQIDPAERLSATEALAHPWLKQGVFSGTRT